MIGYHRVPPWEQETETRQTTARKQRRETERRHEATSVAISLAETTQGSRSGGKYPEGLQSKDHTEMALVVIVEADPDAAIGGNRGNDPPPLAERWGSIRVKANREGDKHRVPTQPTSLQNLACIGLPGRDRRLRPSSAAGRGVVSRQRHHNKTPPRRERRTNTIR
uniref:Uncharacterized protein n=1 Tax=Thermogemmatispora argillosa TaxID=2045280 RepID=A0A455SUG1_9CHLR|nr:hypothetical protein KTA_02620 [Thermogemmatispora argillosa]